MRDLSPRLRGGNPRASWRHFGFVLAALCCSGWLTAQTVTGTVYDETGVGLVGATVMLDGTTTGTVTDFDGNYEINADEGNVLIFSFTGYVPQTIQIGAESVIDVTLEPNVAILDQIVVTGYNQQRKGDITGAVAVLDADELSSVAATSVNQQLEGRATGITTSTSGAAGDGTNIRIRGVSSFTSNDPLIIVDGVPQFNNYLNNINPNDIASVQILKDASAASIYGTRALNGVIIITTKTGQSGKPTITYSGYYGVQDHERGFNDILVQDPQDYAQIFFNAYANDPSQNPLLDFYGGGTTPVIPDYTYVCDGCRNADGSVNEDAYSYPNNLIFGANAEGTDWWDETFRTAPIQDHTLAISGGNDYGTFRVSANYQNQQGTAIESYFERMSARINSRWTLGKMTIGENLNISRVSSVAGGGGGAQNEQGLLIQIVKEQPIIPVYAINGTDYASGKAPNFGNGSNPVARQIRGRDNVGEFDNVTGSLYGDFEVFEGLNLKSQIGINYGIGGQPTFNFPTFENAEPNTNNSFTEYFNRSYNWVWTNTATYSRSFSEVHDVTFLVGYEALRERFRQLNGGISGLRNTNLDIRYVNGGLADQASRTVNSGGNEHTIASSFASLNYTFDNRYLLTATVRRDGSSRFGTDKYGVFPAASLGWRISAEPFMQGIETISDLKLRIGYGVVGNEQIRNYNFVSTFGGGPATTGYAIGGGNSVVTGLTAVGLGNPATTWEEKTTINGGVDLTLLDGKVNVVLDVYTSEVEGLLYNPALPLTGGLIPPAFVNVGQTQNRGFDLALNWRPEINRVKFNLSANISRYVNEIQRIDGNSDAFFSTNGPGIRVSTVPIQINQLGSAIGTFYGFKTNGIWQSQADIDAANAASPDGTFQEGAIPGAIRYLDVAGPDDENGDPTGPDGEINDNDLTIIGSPHPDFTAGLNLGMTIGNFDATAFFFGSFGNEIFNAVKQFTIFRQFNSNVDKRLLTDVWTPENPNASLPALYANTVSNRPSDFYVEDGSYIRLKQLQFGYTFPGTVGGDVISNLRVYLQAQNLFTITDYSGLDPAISSFGASNGQGADDLVMGVDLGNYPTTRIFMVGVNLGF